MKLDFFGRELQIGDEVAFCRPSYRDLVLGKIIKFTPQKIKVEYPGSYNPGSINTYMEHPSCFIKKV